MKITIDQVFEELKLNIEHQIDNDKSIGIQSIGYEFDDKTWVCIIYIPVNLKEILDKHDNRTKV